MLPATITDQQSDSGTKVEVAVQSLDGILIDDSGIADEAAPSISATVAFSGSSANMNVFSSSICAVTGQLLVESEPVVLDRYAQFESRFRTMSVNWEEKVDTNFANGSFKPHLILSLPVQDASIPRAPLAQSNRDSKVTKDHPDIDSQETLSTTTHLTSSTLSSRREPSKNVRGPSVVWSNSGAPMPEIIELFIRLKCDGNESPEHLWQAVAYLVIFGSDEDQGTHTIELPLRKPSYTDEMRTEAGSDMQQRLSLADNACLRVKVKVTKEDKHDKNDKDDHSTEKSSSSVHKSADIVYSQSKMESQLEALRQKIAKNENLATEHYQNQKRAMDVKVPVPKTNAVSSNSAFCHAFPDFTKVYQLLSDAMSRCDVGSSVHHAMPDLPNSGSSVCSTIATRESLGI